MGYFLVLLICGLHAEHILLANIPKTLMNEIAAYQAVVNQIITHVQTGNSRHQAYNRLAYLVDTYGNRPFGSKALNDATDYLKTEMETEFGKQWVRTEDVIAPRWLRGTESARLVSPFSKNLHILGIGYSVSTNGTLNAPAIVVKSFDELEQKAVQVPGKIVVYNQPWLSYSQVHRYRTQGAWRAARLGAVATLVRTLTDYSIYSPHTGAQTYNDSFAKIPSACITVEDAELMQRLQDRGHALMIELSMNHTTVVDVHGRNLVAEIRGTEKPNEIVLFGGHIDSWDVGSGAMDNGGGSMVSWQVLSIVNKLQLRPRRTMRLVLFTAEEIGVVGGNKHFMANKADLGNMSAVMEADYGTFRPLGLEIRGSTLAHHMLQEIGNLLAAINATQVTTNFHGADVVPWNREGGVPAISLYNQADRYFHFHHSEGDTLTVQDPDNMDLCSIVWTTAAYVMADLSIKMPRPDELLNSGASQTVSAATFLLCLMLYLNRTLTSWV